MKKQFLTLPVITFLFFFLPVATGAQTKDISNPLLQNWTTD